MKLNKEVFFKVIIPYFFYFLIIISVFYFRYQLDKENLYITSDGAIKLYQTVQYKEKGFLSLECIYPGKEFDTEFKHFPISYPWAIFQAKENKCVLEYPPFFYWLGSILLFFLPLKLILYLPLLFYAANFFIFDLILQKIGIIPIYRTILTIISLVSFPLLTAMDYTENPAFQTFYLLGFYLFLNLYNEKTFNLKKFLLTGILFGIAFALRLEILLTFSFLCLMFFILTRNLTKPFVVYVGFSFIAALFVVYNIYVSGHPLGFRYVSSIDFNDNAKADIWQRITFLKATIWGNEVMVGIFNFQPLCWLMLLIPPWLVIKKEINQIGNIFLSAGWISIILIPLYITVYGGVGYFGLRYIESAFFLILIGFSVYLGGNYFSKNKKMKIIIVILLILSGYGNWKATKEGLKILKNSSIENAKFQSFIEQSDRFIIHSSLYSTIWMGKSFLEKTHVNLTGNEETVEYIKNIPMSEKFVFILSPEDIYISADIPKKMHTRYKTQINPASLPISIVGELKINGIRLVLANRK